MTQKKKENKADWEEQEEERPEGEKGGRGK